MLQNSFKNDDSINWRSQEYMLKFIYSGLKWEKYLKM